MISKIEVSYCAKVLAKLPGYNHVYNILRPFDGQENFPFTSNEMKRVD